MNTTTNHSNIRRLPILPNLPTNPRSIRSKRSHSKHFKTIILRQTNLTLTPNLPGRRLIIPAQMKRRTSKHTRILNISLKLNPRTISKLKHTQLLMISLTKRPTLQRLRRTPQPKLRQQHSLQHLKRRTHNTRLNTRILRVHPRHPPLKRQQPLRHPLRIKTLNQGTHQQRRSLTKPIASKRSNNPSLSSPKLHLRLIISPKLIQRIILNPLIQLSK